MRCEAERCGSLEDKLTLERYNICILSAYCLESDSVNKQFPAWMLITLPDIATASRDECRSPTASFLADPDMSKQLKQVPSSNRFAFSAVAISRMLQINHLIVMHT